MMNRVFINKTKPSFEGREAVIAHFSWGPADVSDDTTETGFVARKTFEALSVTVLADRGFNALNIEGSIEAMWENAPVLQRNIGLIARYGAEKSASWSKKSARDWWGRRLAGYARTLGAQLPLVPPRVDAARLTPFENTIGSMLWSFADYCGDSRESTLLLPNEMPWWPVTTTEQDFAKSSFKPISSISEREEALNAFRQVQAPTA